MPIDMCLDKATSVLKLEVPPPAVGLETPGNICVRQQEITNEGNSMGKALRKPAKMGLETKSTLRSSGRKVLKQYTKDETCLNYSSKL